MYFPELRNSDEPSVATENRVKLHFEQIERSESVDSLTNATENQNVSECLVNIQLTHLI
jgi:hypothetical protein